MRASALRGVIHCPWKKTPVSPTRLAWGAPTHHISNRRPGKLRLPRTKQFLLGTTWYLFFSLCLNNCATLCASCLSAYTLPSSSVSPFCLYFPPAPFHFVIDFKIFPLKKSRSIDFFFKRERKRHRCERKTSRGCLLYVPRPGTELTTFWCMEMILQPTEPHSQG